jgi:putative sterol carrier protein
MPPTIQTLMLERMPQGFSPELAEGVTANVQFDFSVDDGGLYVVSIADGKCSVREGTIDQPDATMLTSQETYLAVAEGRLNAMTAFMTGKLRVSGNLPLLMQFQQMFKQVLDH